LENLKGRELGRPMRRWEDNIRMNLREKWWEGAASMYEAQNRE
jgi:hypothetical protein